MKVYKELLTHHRRGTNGGGEPHPRWCLDWIWWFWTLRRLDQYFIDSPRVSGILGVFIEQRGGPGESRGGHNPPGRAWAPRCCLGPLGVFWSIKNLREVSLHSNSV